MRSTGRIGMTFTGLALAIGVSAATPAPKITLSAQDQKVMASATCAAAGLDSATARASGTSGVTASVRCRPHAKDGEVPVARVAQCEKKGGSWKCATARDALLVTLYDDSVLAVVSEGVRTVEAVQVVETVAGMSVPPFQNGAIDVLQGECTLRQLPERLFKGATHFKLDCIPATLDVTRDCWDRKCRFFITNAKARD
ncbi:MAG TPA: hypothetical protein VKO83_12170 [Steroidobacteraceae bacterium]|nr:hypothetical protein [Steroidobacteraceae bacterium]